MPPRSATPLSQREIADLVRLAAGADPPAELIVALQGRIRADGAVVADLMRCLVAAPSDVLKRIHTSRPVSRRGLGHAPPGTRTFGHRCAAAFHITRT